MKLEMNPGAAWACLAVGMLLCVLPLVRSLKKAGRLCAKNAWALVLPAALGLIAARGGFELLQMGDAFSSFRWCYTAGLAGMACGTVLAARVCGADGWTALDESAPGLCLGMALARAAQRWMGEAGIGPILEKPNLLSMVNDWEEPVLATWAVEALACLAAAGIVAAAGRRQPRRRGGSFWLAVFLMLIPQILTEQFRSGAYLRFEMMRLEQARFALLTLGGILWLCGGTRRNGEDGFLRTWWPGPAFVACCGVVAALQFMLDGKLMEWPAWLCWTLYAMTIGIMLLISVYSVRRADRGAGGKDEGSR